MPRRLTKVTSRRLSPRCFGFRVHPGMRITEWSRFLFLPRSLVPVLGQLVGDDLRSLHPSEPQPLRLVHAALSTRTVDPVRFGSGQLLARGGSV